MHTGIKYLALTLHCIRPGQPCGNGMGGMSTRGRQCEWTESRGDGCCLAMLWGLYLYCNDVPLLYIPGQWFTEWRCCLVWFSHLQCDLYSVPVLFFITIKLLIYIFILKPALERSSSNQAHFSESIAGSRICHNRVGFQQLKWVFKYWHRYKMSSSVIPDADRTVRRVSFRPASLVAAVCFSGFIIESAVEDVMS